MAQRFLPPSSPAATRILRMDHAHVLADFHKLRADTPAAARAAICRRICTALELHTQLEEELFYPALRELTTHLPSLDHSQTVHADMRRQMERVRQLDEHAAEQTAALHALITQMLQHVHLEETLLLPAAEELLGAERLNELGVRMTRRRVELARPHAVDMAADAVRAAPLKSALYAAGTLLASGLVFQHLRRRRITRH
ncbi:hemerythrin domain-containing protein [Hydrogenophaga sp.]|uniref:hemerythrin domain-containing protein n=1 Tax=Hydrogenophaga sp. TaxID=1904254 RepID=UPI0025C3F194|nr:hemerythrin domain-containing protein [Hydrogenophaga sp.]MBT9463028.1 hemerythrin domain-containing protein [Hydrogenophaga sp.]